MVKNVIFDIGNVILSFSQDFLLSSFYKGEEYDLIKRELFKDWEMLDDDSISYNDYKTKVSNSLPEHLRHYALSVLNNWEYFMTYSKNIQTLIYELKQRGYKLYVLSNMPYYFIEREYKFPIFKEFDGIVYSSPIKLMKPDPKIYEYILNKYSLSASECVFIDDMKKNLAAAARFGIHTYHYQGDTDKLREFILTL